jgi:hypothetical protein
MQTKNAVLTFLAAMLVTLSCKAEQSAAPLPESATSRIEYPSPQAAFEGLQRKPGVDMRREVNGWVIANDKSQNAIWSFSPSSDPSFPAVVKRTIVEKDKNISIEMDVLCGASKANCDNLVRQFLALNEKIKAEIESKRRQPN